jgi:hypothetical protein
LLDVRQEHRKRSVAVSLPAVIRQHRWIGSAGKNLMHIVIVVQRHAELLEVVLAARAAGRFAGGLNRRQQQANQNANDGDHDQQFDQRKPAMSLHG